MPRYSKEKMERLMKTSKVENMHSAYLVFLHGYYLVVCVNSYPFRRNLEYHELKNKILAIELEIYEKEYKDDYKIVGKRMSDNFVVLYLRKKGEMSEYATSIGYDASIGGYIVGWLPEYFNSFCDKSKTGVAQVLIKIVE